ncbi:hypothetical protein Q3W71_20520 [Micromonospora sp. C28SCA-DRY-2]|uniref:hypothetical protein n=1 Tax=Micromonospora sp. C28SCA-DRY-2 TaxID=3059522 RepID=UPI00267561F3|nr:hypothetical protein [Micromonospora sp. C28SCA-DRY-2]MDO3704054.1 hypothetical protein [Micromonospora sp. C28SCA-DRY-2]
MIHVAETLTTHSVEGFLSPTDVEQLATAMDEILAAAGTRRFDCGRTTTMHEIPGLTAAQAMAVYEPAGRIEITELPSSVTAILDRATNRAMPTIRRAMPSVTALRPWTYVEYRTGQHITPHADGIAPDPHTWPRQIGGIGIPIRHADAGGDFYVETTGAPDIWASTDLASAAGYVPGMSLIHDGADNSSAWFRDLPRTRWTVRPRLGDAIVYGSQLTHGTEPVSSGRSRKFISWLIAER